MFDAQTSSSGGIPKAFEIVVGNLPAAHFSQPLAAPKCSEGEPTLRRPCEGGSTHPTFNLQLLRDRPQGQKIKVNKTKIKIYPKKNKTK